ncbi:SpoIIE family protein phosphatase [Amycolatopsis sp. NBC_01488]|uniref:PP2C family protein-serine/threonine phosphatase n=1 Tax=Amycolatopsis sp. NBC_01488 TaxID=2903563 RepID=UPI002E2A6046|nr:GAF domain-containing SpoIIE family protein phosphatase [Amycolatopsis sp. NBC_01488]
MAAVIPAEEPERLAAVRRYAILDTPPDGAFDRVAALAARVLHVPIATVTIVDEDRIWFKAQQGLPEGVREIDRDPGLCASAILQDQAYTVTDALKDPRTSANPLVHGPLGIRFYAAAPITTADGYRLGTVNILDTVPREATDEDLATLSDLAAMVMDELELRLSAMRTVQLERELRTVVESEREHLAHLAGTLQRSLLPPTLPHVAGLQVAAHYQAASRDQVGGDFYDLFPLDDGRWAFFLGDVCGKGPEAAALTSLARYALRSAAIYDPAPIAVLTNLNTVLQHDHNSSRFCTALFGLLAPDGDGFSVTLAGGGHPPAMAIRTPGTVEEVHPQGGQLIGILPNAHFAAVTTRLDPGQSLLLYTDGLTEARTRSGHMIGEVGLVTFLAGLPAMTAGELITALTGLMTGAGPGPTDDTALLALSVPPTAPQEVR